MAQSFSAFLEDQLRELHGRILERYEELMVPDDARFGLLGRRHGSARKSVLGINVPGAVDTEDASSYSSRSEIFDPHRLSILSRDGLTSEALCRHLEPDPVVPEPRPTPRRRSLLQCPEGPSSLLSDLGIIPRARRKSDAGVPGFHMREERADGQSLRPKDTHLDRVSENSEPKPGRISSKQLRVQPPGHPEQLEAAEDLAKPTEEPRQASKSKRRVSKDAVSVGSFFASSFFRSESLLKLPGPGCEPLATDFGYEFELLECWHRSEKHLAKVTKFHRLVTRSSLSKFLMGNTEDEEDSEVSYAIKPFSTKKIAWDLVVFLVVLHDGVVLPLQLLGIQIYAWGTLGWLFAIIWSIDPVVSSCMSYERQDGTWEQRISRTFRKYLQGFFVLDVVLAILSWVELFVSSQTFQMVRVLRLARLWRIEAIIQLISNNIRSERAVLCIGISGKILWLMVFLHFVACYWVALGRKEGGWVSHQQADASEMEQYGLAFHWALAQFHGTMELHPSSLEERIFASSYLLLAYLLAVVFISFITSAMTRLHLITGLQSAHQRVLRWFLIDNGISRQLTARIHSNLKATLTAQQHAVPEAEVEFLALVSENLRMELHCEMYGPTLRHHPLFEPINAQLVKQLCHTAITMAMVSHGDVVFIQGEVPVEPRMVFVIEGGLTYFRSARGESLDVTPGTFAAEPVLWTDWLHHGTLRVASFRTRLLLLNSNRFQELGIKTTSPDLDLFAYALEYVRQLNELHPHDRHDLWDGIDTSRL